MWSKVATLKGARRKGAAEDLRRKTHFPNNRHPVFDTVHTIRDLGEVVLAERFLVGVEGAVVGTGALEVAAEEENATNRDAWASHRVRRTLWRIVITSSQKDCVFVKNFPLQSKIDKLVEIVALATYLLTSNETHPGPRNIATGRSQVGRHKFESILTITNKRFLCFVRKDVFQYINTNIRFSVHALCFSTITLVWSCDECKRASFGFSKGGTDHTEAALVAIINRTVSTQCLPRQQRHQISRSGWVRSKWGSHHVTSSVTPALVPVVGSVGSQASGDRLAEHNVAWKIIEIRLAKSEAKKSTNRSKRWNSQNHWRNAT